MLVITDRMGEPMSLNKVAQNLQATLSEYDDKIKEQFKVRVAFERKAGRVWALCLISQALLLSRTFATTRVREMFDTYRSSDTSAILDRTFTCLKMQRQQSESIANTEAELTEGVRINSENIEELQASESHFFVASFERPVWLILYAYHRRCMNGR